MNREIKFRAWDTVDHSMTSHPGVEIAGSYTLPSFLAYLEERYVLMQFTSLKDKNGKDVFEGDIVRFKWNPIFNEPSVMDEFQYERPVSYYDKWGCFVMTIFSTKGENQRVAVGSPTEAGGTIEVIGNIYQNPELLATPPHHEN